MRFQIAQLVVLLVSLSQTLSFNVDRRASPRLSMSLSANGKKKVLTSTSPVCFIARSHPLVA